MHKKIYQHFGRPVSTVALVSAMLFLSCIAMISSINQQQQPALADSNNQQMTMMASSSSPSSLLSSNAQKQEEDPMQIQVEQVEQLPSGIPNATSLSQECERNNNLTGPTSQDCQIKFIGKTDSQGQIWIFTNTIHVFPRPPQETSYVVVTVTDRGNNNNSRPIAKAIVDGIVKYTIRSGVDTVDTTVSTAFVHALKPNLSDWTYTNWTAASQPPNNQQQIIQIAQQVASQTGANPQSVQQTLQQLAIQVAGNGGDADQAVAQIAQQIAQGNRTISQSLAQIAQQQSSGDIAGTSQGISQLAQQIAKGSNPTTNNTTTTPPITNNTTSTNSTAPSMSNTTTNTIAPPSSSMSSSSSSANKTFYLFTTEVEGVNKTKLGFSGDVYSLQTIVINKGDNVTIHFYNLEKDVDERHSFTMGAPYNIDKELAGGENATITFTASQEGIFQYHCKFHPEEMIGQLVVLK